MANPDHVPPSAGGQQCTWRGPHPQAEADDNSAIPGCELEHDHIHLIRYIFKLPGYLAVPDGTTIPAYYPSAEDRADNAAPFVLTTIRQIELEADDDLTLSIRVADRVMKSLNLADRSGSDEEFSMRLERWHSVADIITSDSSPDAPPEGWDGRPQHLGPRSDQFMRALHAVRETARSIALTGRRSPVLPTYERTPLMMHYLTAVAPGDSSQYRIPADEDWTFNGVIHLEHENIPGDGPSEEDQTIVGQTMDYWRRCLDAKLPATFARERFLEAARLLNQDGEYAAAIVAASTGVEILCDALLSATLWEAHFVDPGADGPGAASRLFGDVTPLSRAAKQLAPLIGGDWNSRRSAWQQFRGGTSALRNRVVHAGYSPSRAEAQLAIDQAAAVQGFLLDRVAERANTYPRVTWLVVGEDGLIRRNRYRGKIKKFVEQVAPHEDWYIESFGEWHQALVLAANKTS